MSSNASKATDFNEFPPGAVLNAQNPIIVVSSYTTFNNLAHGPAGTEAECALWTFRLDSSTGRLVLISVNEEPIINPAFSRLHPRREIMYTCTESVMENGAIVAYSYNSEDGSLKQKSTTDAKGTSTCYITIDKACKNMLIVNYWDASIHVFGLDRAGSITDHRFKYDPNHGRKMVAQSDQHVNHSINDEEAQKKRQADPHSHAVILDPYYGQICYVPDLGKDTVGQYLFDPETGRLTSFGEFASGQPGSTALGPRYIEFHPSFPIAYVINELSSEVAVFEFDHRAAEDMMQAGPSKRHAKDFKPTLRLVQNISTIPSGFPKSMNTCGRITVHKSGDHVLCSNRGHDSITSFHVHHNSSPPGLLSLASIHHTHGSTPRHFTFDPSGQWLLAANQDSDSLSVFRFNLARGDLVEVGKPYSIPSPNFVCAIDAWKRPDFASAATSAATKVAHEGGAKL